MTGQNGQVQVLIDVPGLGKVAGKQSLADIVGRKPQQVEQGPAVQYEPLDAPLKTASDSGSVKPEPEPAKPVKSAKPDKPKKKDLEKSAAKQLQLAKNYYRAKLTVKAVDILRKLVRDCPGTRAAATAETLIDQWAAQIEQAP